MIKNRVLFYLFILILPIWSYKFETCCSNESSSTNTTTSSIRLLSCPLNFVIKLRSVIFYTGNDCAPSACQRRLNKHYLSCNNHRTCSISIKCIHMDSSICSWLKKDITHAQHLIVDYDCILYEPEPPLIALNRHNNIKTDKPKEDDKENIVLFSAKINIESPPDINNDSISDITDDERLWKDYIFKKYFNGKRPLLTNIDDKPIIIQQQRSLFSDILRTVIILIVFTLILMVLMLFGLFIYKRIILLKKKKLFGHHNEQQKHEPFPGDEAYDNLKTSTAGSTTDSGAATDV